MTEMRADNIHGIIVCLQRLIGSGTRVSEAFISEIQLLAPKDMCNQYRE